MAIPEALTSPLHIRDLFDFLPPVPAVHAFFLMLGAMRGQENQLGEKKQTNQQPNTGETFLLRPSYCVSVSQHHCLTLNASEAQKWSDSICISVSFSFVLLAKAVSRAAKFSEE